MQAGTCLLPHVNYDVAVMWLIPPLNRSPSFKVPTIIPPVKLVTVLLM